MSDEPRPFSERARRRALGKLRREASIKRQEVYFDLLVSGYSIEEIASQTKKSPLSVRRVVAQALANRRLDAPENYARLQVARLTKALRCADLSLEEGDLKAIAPLTPPLALTHSPGLALAEVFEDGKSRATAHPLSDLILRGSQRGPLEG